MTPKRSIIVGGVIEEERESPLLQTAASLGGYPTWSAGTTAQARVSALAA